MDELTTYGLFPMDELDHSYDHSYDPAKTMPMTMPMTIPMTIPEKDFVHTVSIPEKGRAIPSVHT